MKRLIPATCPESFLNLADMGVSEAMAILEQWLQAAGRVITKDQRDVMVRNYRTCQVPLYLRVLYREALTWPSTMPGADIRLGGAVKNVITVFIGRLERDHGESLVRRGLGYITAARCGLTEAELEDLLSLDDMVMSDVMAHCKPALRRLPTLLWARLRKELDEYLVETMTDDCVTLMWSHMTFREAAEDRYMKSKDKAPSYHKALAEYFADMWTDKPKPYQGNEIGSKRYTLGQPLYRIPESGATDGDTTRVYNIRRLNELPYHFIHSQQMSLLKKECLCNFEFLLAKISGIGLRAAYDDFRMALTAEPADLDLKLLSDTLHLSISALIKDPRQLASQIIGRMHDIITKDVPTAPGDPVRYPALKEFFEQAKNGSIPALIPSITCLTPPSGVLFDQLSGHTEPITAVCMSMDGQKCLTSSKDDTLKTWELRSGRVIKTIHGVGADVRQIGIGGNYAIAITSETAKVRLWSLRSGECLKVIDEYEDPATIVMAADGMLLVAFYQGINVMRVWAMGGKFALTQEVFLSDDQIEDTGVHQENSIVVGTNAYGALVLHANRNSSEAYVMNVKKGRVVLTLTAKKSGCITAMACTPEYFILALKSQYMETHELYTLALFDNRSGKFIRDVRGCVEDDVTQLLVNHIGSHAVAICASEANNASNIAIWNIETEEHKHVGKHAKVSHLGACVDLRYCLTASNDDSTLKIWNLTSMVNQPGTKGKIKDGLEDIILMTGNSRYVIAKSMNNGPIAVWNIAKGRCAGKAVHIERGLVNSTDVMLVRNTTILVLTDKGFSSATDNSPAVYQTLLIYDLLKKKYIQKLNNCYITPALPHEYVFLSDEQLMGLSDTHNHLVVWSTSTGRVVHRMKANFRDIEKRTRDAETSEADQRRRKRATTAKMSPWDRRAESESARARRHHEEILIEKQRMDDLHHEKDNIIEQFKISSDLSTVITSHYAHHLCVFDVQSQSHVQTLENHSSMLFLYTSAMTVNGSHLVHTNYDEEAKLSYLTLWDAREGYVRKRLRNEKNVTCVDISNDASRIVFGKSTKELRIWEPLAHGRSMRRIKGYPTLNFGDHSQIHIIDDGRRAVVYAGDISLWDLEDAAVLGVFTPDMRIQCFTPAMGGRLVVFGLQDTSDIVTLRLMSSRHKAIEKTGQDLFGESVSSDEDDEEMEAQLELE
ncbi:hypothetical protein LSH36_1062g00016 [Paralvinella palmiformis]|uniref:NWD1/2-like winged helix-turn-helix domain-containing protein n=1 Tax=Paralvinella palmiformis TaxID=53620 RepID=A0AAD9IVB1_9ANNE|nr:hypothetical protein LSH36_1062g00016 [Paralvinella palmiformis]